MKSSGPRYLRKRSSDATTSTNVDNEYPKYAESKYLANNNTDQDLNLTGLREKKLLALIIWLAVLFLLALILLIINILIINVLQMTHHGMKSLKIYNYEDPITHEEESVVHFTAAKSHFDHVTVESGKLFGPKNQNFLLKGSRVILGEPTENTTKFLLQEGKCKFENVDQFVVLSSSNKKTLFSAQHPLVSIDHKIKKLSSSLIITNKVRSPVNEDLKIDGENVVIRGNEGIQLEAKTFNISAATVIALNTSADGNLYFSGRNIYFGNHLKTLLMSSSPALSASIEAFRKNLLTVAQHGDDQGDTASAEDELHLSSLNKIDSYVFDDRITIYVEPGFDTIGGTQMCLATFVPNSAALSTAIKHFYSRLSSFAAELDQGIPDILISFVSTDTVLGAEAKAKVTAGLSKIVSHCGLWLITSGEQNDPLAAICTSVVKSILPHSDRCEETLIIAINSVDAAQRATSIPSKRRQQAMADTSVNTYYFVLNRQNLTPRQKFEFRSHAAIKLANPPPALLIGVPVENTANSSSQTPSGTLSPAIILPNSVKHDCRPLPVTLFCGTALASIFELKNYLECGVPCLIVQDASDICALLRTSHIFYRSANFAHDNFIAWLKCELRAIMVEEGECDFTLDEAQKAVCQCLSVAMGDHCLLSFISSDSLDSLPNYLIELLMRAATSNDDYRQTLSLAVKLNVATVLKTVKMGSLFNDEQFENILVDALCYDYRIDVVDALLDNHPYLHVTPRLLMRWLDNVVDLDFFNIVVVGQCLGYSNKLSTFGEDFANDMDSLFFRLSGGFSNLFPVDYFSQPNPTKDRSKSMQILALWALCLNQVEVVKCIWAHSPEPMPLALVMSRIAKSLAFEGREYFFYEERLKILAHYLTNAACNLLDEAYKSAPKPAYLTLCQKLSNFNRLTMTRLAYETNNREFISHECCQRWVLRLFYSNLKIGQIVNGISLPRWLKILLSAVFVVPIWIWISVGPSSSEFSGHDLPPTEQPKPQVSPTVALLQNGQPKKRVRAASTYSMHSGRSYGLHKDETAAPSRDERNAYNAAHTTIAFGTETPRSGIAPSLHVGGNDEIEAMIPQDDRKFRSSLDIPSRRKGVRRKATRASFGEFYSAPIVKYWLSLTFRVLYLCFFAYSIALPGCGNAWFDYALWLWTLMWLVESIWVIYLRCRDTNISQLRWTLFDVISVSLFLIALITFESTGRLMIKYVSFPSAYLVKVIWSCLLLYQCYATLFIYIPLSDLLGPLLVRVKLMVTRDFVYFFILVSLAVCSTAIAVKAIVYPDLEPTLYVIKNHISWAWMQLFTTDLKALEQTDKCRATFLAPRSRDYCTTVGGFANHECPADSHATYFVIVEYLIVLKLICWPLLFALFAKTAKEVDDEADKIWKYQLYGLATDFSLRPCLPPPFTPLFFIGVTCCQLSSCACGFFNKISFTSSDHPDVVHHSRNDTSLSPSKLSVVYRNPSVPNQKIGSTKHFYCKAALNYWKSSMTNTDSRIERRLSELTKSLNEKVHHLIVSSNFSGIAAQSDERKVWSAGDPDESKKVVVNERYRSWHVLIPDYCPPNYSKPSQEFPQELQKYVDQTSPHHLADLCKQWRQKKLHDILKEKSTDLQLSTIGLPLNPSGRTGLSGRGNLVKFGPNNLQFYVIIIRTTAQQLMILTTPDNDLPNKQRYDYNRADEYLHNILTAINVPDPSAQIYSTKGHLTTSQIDNCVSHVCIQPLSSNEDTDNAWTEADVWAVNLTEPIDYHIQMSPNGFKWQPSNYHFSQKLRNDFVKQSLRAFKLQT